MAAKRYFQYAILPAVLVLSIGCKPEATTYDRLVIDTFMPETSLAVQNDTYLTLFDSAGNILAEDDNGNPDQVNHNLCSRIDYQDGLASGTYYIKVHKPTVDGNPNYCIRVVDYNPGTSFPTEKSANETTETVSDDAVGGDGLPTSPWSISLDEVISRSIYPELTDVDWYELVLP